MIKVIIIKPIKIFKKKFVLVPKDSKLPQPEIDIEKTAILNKNIINSNIIICFFKYYEFITFILSKKTIGINLNPLIYLLKKINGLNKNLTNHPRQNLSIKLFIGA